MKITKQLIKDLNPCSDRFINFTSNYPDYDNTIDHFISLDKISYSDKIWVITKLFTKEQNVKFSILCSESVLHIFESKYPEDNRPRLAIEAAKTWLNDPSEVNRLAARSAAYAAWSAAWSAAYYAANAARSAANAAYAATTANAANAANVATYAANAAAYAVAYAANAEIEQQDLNLQFILMCVKKCKGIK